MRTIRERLDAKNAWKATLALGASDRAERLNWPSVFADGRGRGPMPPVHRPGQGRDMQPGLLTAPARGQRVS